MPARRFSLRFSACYAFLTVGAGVQLPFLPLWLDAKGVDAGGIAAILAGMMVSRAIASPTISYLADHFNNRVSVIRICSAFTLAANVLLAQMDGFWPICLAALLTAFAFAPVFPLTESYSVDGSAAHGLDYGRLRLWASVGFLSGSLIAGGLLTWLPPLSAVWLIVAGQASSFLATVLLPSETRHPHAHASVMPDVGNAWRFLFVSRFTVIMIAVSLGQASHAMINSFGSVYWDNLGFSTFVIGIFWVFAVMTEVLFFAVSRNFARRFGSDTFILVGLISGVVRWGGMVFLTDIYSTSLLQTLHAITFATTHLGTMYYIRETVPSRMRNTAQGLYSAVSGGICMAAVTWLSGHLYQSFGANAFLMMSVLSGLAFLIAFVTFRFAPKGLLAAAE